jgi:hypothetical protein
MMNELLGVLGHSAIWAGVRVFLRDHPSLALAAVVLGALLILWRRPGRSVRRSVR